MQAFLSNLVHCVPPGTTDQLFHPIHLFYWLFMFFVVLYEAATFGEIWKRREAARWTMGYFTVFLVGVPLVSIGFWDAVTYIGLFFAVGMSGAAKVGWEHWRDSRLAAYLRQQAAVPAEEGDDAPA